MTESEMTDEAIRDMVDTLDSDKTWSQERKDYNFNLFKHAFKEHHNKPGDDPKPPEVKNGTSFANNSNTVQKVEIVPIQSTSADYYFGKQPHFIETALRLNEQMTFKHFNQSQTPLKIVNDDKDLATAGPPCFAKPPQDLTESKKDLVEAKPRKSGYQPRPKVDTTAATVDPVPLNMTKLVRAVSSANV
jgi:hypothetical protein